MTNTVKDQHVLLLESFPLIEKQGSNTDRATVLEWSVWFKTTLRAPCLSD